MEPYNDEHEPSPMRDDCPICNSTLTEISFTLFEKIETLQDICDAAERLLRELYEDHPDAAITFQARTLDHHLEVMEVKHGKRHA